MHVDCQVRSIPTGATQGQNDRPPILGMLQFVFQFEQIAASSLEQHTSVLIAPTGLDFLASYGPLQNADQGDRYGRTNPVDKEHDGQAASRSGQRRAPMTATKPRPVAGVLGDRFVKRGQIQ